MAEVVGDLMQQTLLIFTKPPRMGLAKTRLARDVGVVEAQRINRFCHSRAMRAAIGGSWTSVLCIAPDHQVDATPGDLWPVHFERRRQGGGDLGDRLARAFHASPPGPVMVIGTDTPDISHRLIRQGFAALRGHDAMFGPAEDGGFWLFGASHALRRRRLRFNPVRWSTRHAMSDLTNTLPSGARIAALPMLMDIDDAAALKAWMNLNLG